MWRKGFFLRFPPLSMWYVLFAICYVLCAMCYMWSIYKNAMNATDLFWVSFSVNENIFELFKRLFYLLVCFLLCTKSSLVHSQLHLLKFYQKNHQWIVTKTMREARVMDKLAPKSQRVVSRKIVHLRVGWRCCNIIRKSMDMSMFLIIMNVSYMENV